MDSGTPSPAPANNQRNIIIAVVVVLVLLCCCCSAIGIVGYLYGDQIVQQFGRILPTALLL